MNYITAKEAADKWKTSLRQVQQYCALGRITGVVRKGHQWMIPAIAEKPVDGRLVEAKKTGQSETYHFPLLVYTEYYASREVLSIDENRLLDAQILNLQNNFTESVRICKELLSKECSQSVAFGACFTNAINFQMLGLLSEIPFCLGSMEKMCRKYNSHQEDYRLLIAYFSYNSKFDLKPFLDLDVEKLSGEALTTYKLLSIVYTIFSNSQISDASLRVFKAVCKELDLIGIEPACLQINMVLAVHSSRKGNKEAEIKYIKEVCRLGQATGMDRLLSKVWTVLNTELYYKCLAEYDISLAKRIERLNTFNIEKWRLFYRDSSGVNKLFVATNLEYEIVCLLGYKMKISDIAMLKNISEKEVRSIIKGLCTRFSLKSKNELVEYYKQVFASDELLIK